MEIKYQEEEKKRDGEERKKQIDLERKRQEEKKKSNTSDYNKTNEDLYRNQEEIKQTEPSTEIYNEKENYDVTYTGQTMITESRLSLPLRELPSLTMSSYNNGEVFFELSNQQKKDLNNFFSNLGLSQLADHFAKEAVDLSTMVAWSNPMQELQSLGVKQHGVLLRIVEALKQKHRQSDQYTYSDTMYNSSNPTSPLSDLGELVMQRGEQLLNLAKSIPDSDPVKQTQLVTVVHLNGMDLQFSFEVRKAVDQ